MTVQYSCIFVLSDGKRTSRDYSEIDLGVDFTKDPDLRNFMSNKRCISLS